MASLKVKIFCDSIQSLLNYNFLLKDHFQRLYMFLVSGKTYHQTFFLILRELHCPLQVFKMLIFTHYCLNKNLKMDKERLVESLSEISFETNNNSFQDYLVKSVLQPYLAYIQKRCLHQLIRVQEENAILQSYKNINLLGVGIKFTKSMAKLARYFSKQYPFIMDFNQVLAIDFLEIYKQIENCLKTINKADKHYQLIMKELQGIHETMYHVYQNPSYYKQMKKYMPEWIDTQLQLQQILKHKTKSLEKPNHKTDDSITSMNKEEKSRFEVEEYEQILTELIG